MAAIPQPLVGTKSPTIGDTMLVMMMVGLMRIVQYIQAWDNTAEISTAHTSATTYLRHSVRHTANTGYGKAA
jgi:hypothetical protein